MVKSLKQDEFNPNVHLKEFTTHVTPSPEASQAPALICTYRYMIIKKKKTQQTNPTKPPGGGGRQRRADLREFKTSLV